MEKQELEEKLVVGAKIKIGKEYSKDYFFEEGEVILLEKGHDEVPSFYNESDECFYNIYHFFGDDFEYWMDNTIIE